MIAKNESHPSVSHWIVVPRKDLSAKTASTRSETRTNGLSRSTKKDAAERTTGTMGVTISTFGRYVSL